jgi:hypothetical protein
MYAGFMLPLFLAWTLGCAGPPTDSLTWREQWEIFVLTEDGSLIEGRVSVGNTGLYRGQGHFKASRWMPGTTPILFAMSGGPADVDVGDAHESVRVGSALLGQYEDGPHWSLRLANEEANAIMRVEPGGPEVELATAIDSGGQWTSAVPISHGRAHGWFTAGRRGGMFEGRAVAIHRGGDGAMGESRNLVALLGTDISIGLDEQGGTRSVWARMGDQDVPTVDLKREVDAQGRTILDFRPSADLVATVTPGSVGGSFDGHEGLFGFERVVARTAGSMGERHVHRARADIEWKGATISASALVLTVE